LYIEAEFLYKITTKVFRVILLVLHSHLYSFALRFLFLQIHATSYSFCKEERRITDRKPYPLPYGLRNPYRNLKSENSQDYAQKPQWILYVHEFGFSTTFHLYVSEDRPACTNCTCKVTNYIKEKGINVHSIPVGKRLNAFT
jgi:hypothetical protein